MIYKTLLLVVVVSLLGMNTGMAQEPCDCIGEISTAVQEVMATTDCDGEMTWEAPKALEVHLAKLQNWCGAQDKPLKSKVPNIIEGMLETIEDAFAGESYTDPITEMVVVVKVPAPECAWDALNDLKSLLENGCSTIVE